MIYKKVYIILTASIILLIFCSTYTPNHSSAKQKKIHRKSEIELLSQKALEFLNKEEADSAIELYSKALSLISKSDTNNYLEIIVGLGSSYYKLNNHRSCISILINCEYLFQRLNKESIIKNTWADGLLLLAGSYWNINEMDSAQIYLQLLESTCLEIDFKSSYLYLAQIYTWKALIFSRLGDNDKAIYFNIKSIQIFEEYEDSIGFISNNYSHLGEIFTQLNDNEKAERYYKKSLSVIESRYPKKSILRAHKLNDLGYHYFENDQFESALKYFEEGHHLFKTLLDTNNYQLAYSYNNLGDAYCHTGNIANGIKSYNRAIKIFEKNKSLNEISIVYHNLGIANFKNQNYKEALNYYNRALRLGNKSRYSNNIYTAFTLRRIGQLYRSQEKYDSAIYYYQEAIKELTYNSCASVYQNPSFLNDSVLSVFELFENLYFKGTCQYLEHKKDSNKLGLQKSLRTLNYALSVLEFIRNNYNNELPKLKLSKEGKPLVDTYIALLLNLSEYEDYGSNNINEYIRIIEQNNYTALRSIIKTTKIVNSDDIPHNLIHRIDTLNRKIRLLRNIVNKQCLETSLAKTAESHLLLSMYVLDTVDNYINIKYPNYEIDLHTNSTYTAQDIKSALNDSSAIIEYFLNDHHLVIIAISKTEHIVYSKEIDAGFQSAINMFSKSIYFSDFEKFISQSQFLYSELIDPIKGVLDNISYITIIPSKQMNQLPFEALVSEYKWNQQESNSYKYLISDYNISYQFSLNLWLDNINNNLDKPKKKWDIYFSGIAPITNGQISENLENKVDNSIRLPYSESEIYFISDIFAKQGHLSSTFCGKNATETVFMDAVQNSKIVHIATHNIENHILFNSNYDYSNTSLDEINYFASSFISPNDGVLSVSEIYNLDVNSDLVVLSTCNSGTGKLFTGEGIYSLAIGLYHSGARNLIYTISRISDKHTKLFMIKFYNYVCKGFPYSVALRKTKLDFINSDYKLPIFWSGFVLNN